MFFDEALPSSLPARPVIRSPPVAASLFRARASAGCVTECEALTNDLSTAGNLATICTQAVVNDYNLCFTCQVSSTLITQEEVQSTLNEFFDGCKEGGFPLGGSTLDTSSASGSSGPSVGSSVRGGTTVTSPGAPSPSTVKSGGSPGGSDNSPPGGTQTNGGDEDEDEDEDDDEDAEDEDQSGGAVRTMRSLVGLTALSVLVCTVLL
ncbi:hypothetical protein C8J57DRAFT_352299 [Mycena rebaudengoi]|nr:hypothetical protein C8J57DRAFT_352299 [Mycena rebaudengoi]